MQNDANSSMTKYTTKFAKESEVQLNTIYTKPKAKHSSFRHRFDVEEPSNRFIDSDRIKAFTGQSEGIKNTFDNNECLLELNKLLSQKVNHIDNSKNVKQEFAMMNGSFGRSNQRLNNTITAGSDSGTYKSIKSGSLKHQKNETGTTRLFPNPMVYDTLSVTEEGENVMFSAKSITRKEISNTLKDWYPNLQLILDRYGSKIGQTASSIKDEKEGNKLIVENCLSKHHKKGSLKSTKDSYTSIQNYSNHIIKGSAFKLFWNQNKPKEYKLYNIGHKVPLNHTTELVGNAYTSYRSNESIGYHTTAMSSQKLNSALNRKRPMTGVTRKRHRMRPFSAIKTRL